MKIVFGAHSCWPVKYMGGISWCASVKSCYSEPGCIAGNAKKYTTCEWTSYQECMESKLHRPSYAELSEQIVIFRRLANSYPRLRVTSTEIEVELV